MSLSIRSETTLLYIYNVNFPIKFWHPAPINVYSQPNLQNRSRHDLTSGSRRTLLWRWTGARESSICLYSSWDSWEQTHCYSPSQQSALYFHCIWEDGVTTSLLCSVIQRFVSSSSASFSCLTQTQQGMNCVDCRDTSFHYITSRAKVRDIQTEGNVSACPTNKRSELTKLLLCSSTRFLAIANWKSWTC